MSPNKHDLLSDDIAHTLKRMTLPMILGMILLMTFSLVDTFFVSLLGTEQLAAISFTFPVTFTVISLNIGLGIGTSAVIGRVLGSGKLEDAKQIATAALVLSALLVGGLALIGLFAIDTIFMAMAATEALLPYIKAYMVPWYAAGVFLAIPMVGNSVLRASGDTKTPSIIMAVGGAINAALDPLLIFGLGPIPAMGIAGAAIATIISWAIGAVWIIYLLAYKRRLMEPRILPWRVFKTSSKGVLKIGLPAAGANMLTPVANGIVTAFVASYGAAAVAAWGVGNRLESIASIVVLALSMSLPPFISQNFGAGKLDRVAAAYKICARFVLVWQLVVFILLWSMADTIALVFSDESAVASNIVLFLSIVPLAYGIQGIVILANSSFNAMHQPFSALALSIIRLFVVYIPIVYVAGEWFGLIGIFWGCVIANMLTACIAYWWFNQSIQKQITSSVSN